MPTLAPLALVVGAFLAFSFMPIFARESGAPVLAMAAWRAVTVAALFGLWTAASKERLVALRMDRRSLRLAVTYGLALALASSTFVGGYALTTVANTVFLHNLAPVAAFPLAWWLFRERPTGQGLTGAAVAIGGVALLSGVSIFQFSQFANPRFLLGDLLALISAIGYAGVLVMTRRVRMEGLPVLATLTVAWGVAAVLLSALALGMDTMAMPSSALPWVLGLAVICTNLPFYLLNLGMRAIPAGLTSVISMSEVLFTTLVGAVVYREALAPIGWLGALLVVIGLVYPLMRGGAEEEEQMAADPEAPQTPAQAPPAAPEEPTPHAAAQPGPGTPKAPPPRPPRRRAPPPMAPESGPWRKARLALYILLFNVGALWLLLGGAPTGALLAWTGLIGLLRLGAWPAAIQLEGRFQPMLRWGGALTAIVAMAGAFGARAVIPSGSAGLLVVASAVALLDAWLAGHESPADRDPAPLLGASVGIVAVAQGAAMIGHPAGHWLMTVAALTAALAGWTVLLAALHGNLPTGPVSHAGGVPWADGLVARIGRPRVLAGTLLALFLAGGIHQVPTGHQAVVERFGFPLPEVAQAGLLLRLPPPIERIVPIDVATIREEPVVEGGSPLLCGDQSMVSLEAALQWRVSDASAFAFGAVDPAATLGNLARSSLVEEVAHLSADEVLTTGRASLEARVTAGTQRAADREKLGVQVEGLHLSAAAVPAPVTDAFLDVISAEEEKRSRINQAEAYAAAALPRARGRALALLEAAEGERQQLAAHSETELATFQALAKGGASAPELTRLRLTHERIAAALAPANVVLASPDLDLWVGGQPVSPAQLAPDSSKKDR